MGKGKKKNKKKQSLYKAVKPFIKDTRVLYSLLGAVGVGVALASAIGTDKGRALLDRITTAVKELGQDQAATQDQVAAQDQAADKKVKSAKQFATE